MSKIVKFWQLYQLVQYVLKRIDEIFHEKEIGK